MYIHKLCVCVLQDGVAVRRPVVSCSLYISFLFFKMYLFIFRFYIFFFAYLLKHLTKSQLLNTLLQPASPNVAIFPKVFIFTSDPEPLN
jgi:hypothetical protein